MDFEQALNEESHPLMEMANIGSLSGAKKICVFPNEGPVRHFHIFTGRDPKIAEWHTCIEFESPAYFHHIGKTDTLEPKEKRELCDFFSAPYKWIPSITNWQHALSLWNDNNPQWEISMDTPMPEYTLL